MGRELSGKVAIITGGACGIGRATAELFIAEGARVVVADVASELGESLVEELGDAAIFKHTDVADVDQVQALVDFAAAHFGGLHVMVNNAGISCKDFGPFLDSNLRRFDRVIAVNLFGVMVGTQLAARHMAENGGGSIINTSSMSAFTPGRGVMSYRASKAGVIAFSKSAALEFGEYGIRVNCIAPGLIPTGMTTASFDVASVAARLQPLRRRGVPADVANAALYLPSERSAQVTGIVLPVDGGASLGPAGNPLDKASPRAAASNT